MKGQAIIILALAISLANQCTGQNTKYNTDDFAITEVSVTHQKDLGMTVWEMTVKGNAGQTIPTETGKLDGAHVLGYVFPTSLSPENVGFSATDGIVALALTSHPDFDDTPLWDENNDKNYGNDGVVWHPHWVVLHQDSRVAGGFSVKQFKKADKTVVLPQTSPGMPMYMDSPGFQTTTKSHTIRAIIPDYRISNVTDFKFDGVTAFMKINTSNMDLPMLGVYEVFGVASGDLSLPFIVSKK
ncbi:hypothetical protein [Jiulongibacter sediminis]|uniref:Lipoprotein n=1 Tax=Jiulongibacter sediminis TaxID=1605367 RepID=A0A0P7C4D3_9BACT|nr:hypothetical protein [Jiulongibacter sediminis]KPM48089.1 hypothetical protein AFM12_12945 [Jiulongibacter sediminis]TBX24269.1 hypothetical protein TK44_12955 [Jiulongibacter sediminis]